VFPRLFQIGSFYLPTYGVLVASGVLIGLWISVRNSEKQGINGDDAWNLGILVVLAGIVGAKIFYVVNDWSSYANKLAPRFSASTPCRRERISGGLIGALLMAAWYMRRHHMPVLRTTTASRPVWPSVTSSALRLLFSRNAVTAKPTNHFWGVIFHNPWRTVSVELRSASGSSRHN